MKLKQRKRAYARNVGSLLKILFGIMAILSLVVIISSSYTYYTTKTEKFLETKEIYISAGTTAWDLWDRKVSWDEFCWDLQKLNNCDISSLKVGQILLVPKYREVIE